MQKKPLQETKALEIAKKAQISLISSFKDEQKCRFPKKPRVPLSNTGGFLLSNCTVIHQQGFGEKFNKSCTKSAKSCNKYQPLPGPCKSMQVSCESLQDSRGFL